MNTTLLESQFQSSHRTLLRQVDAATIALGITVDDQGRTQLIAGVET